ncbi:hypothetical protein Q9Q97_17525 [Flavobacterium sp. DG2-3]|nr:hypothetical protein [Flavobacterium sp. DG2-3]
MNTEMCIVLFVILIPKLQEKDRTRNSAIRIVNLCGVSGVCFDSAQHDKLDVKHKRAIGSTNFVGRDFNPGFKTKSEIKIHKDRNILAFYMFRSYGTYSLCNSRDSTD